MQAEASGREQYRQFGLSVQPLGCKTLALCCVGCEEKFHGHFMICLGEGGGSGTAEAYLLCVRWSVKL